MQFGYTKLNYNHNKLTWGGDNIRDNTLVKFI